MTAVSRLLSGEEIGFQIPGIEVSVVWHISAESLRKLARSLGSLAALLPLPMGFGDDIIASVRTENGTKFYTAGDLAKLLKRDKAAEGVATAYEQYLKEVDPFDRFPPVAVMGNGGIKRESNHDSIPVLLHLFLVGRLDKGKARLRRRFRSHGASVGAR